MIVIIIIIMMGGGIYGVTVPANGARGDKPNLEGAVFACGGDLRMVGAGGEGYHRRRLPIYKIGSDFVDFNHYIVAHY